MEYLRLAPVPTTGPTVEPYSLAEAKDDLGIEDDDSNARVSRRIVAARRKVEEETRRQLITATWTGHLDRFPPEGLIWLPVPPLISVTSVSYLDVDGATQTLTENTDFIVDSDSEPGRITLAYGQSWPSTREQANAVTIVFVAGFGATPATVPTIYKQAISMLIEHWYDPTAGVKFKAIADLPEGIRNVLSTVRIPRGR